MTITVVKCIKPGFRLTKPQLNMFRKRSTPLKFPLKEFSWGQTLLSNTIVILTIPVSKGFGGVLGRSKYKNING